jgi:hypothetical protein
MLLARVCKKNGIFSGSMPRNSRTAGLSVSMTTSTVVLPAAKRTVVASVGWLGPELVAGPALEEAGAAAVGFPCPDAVDPDVVEQPTSATAVSRMPNEAGCRIGIPFSALPASSSGDQRAV